MNTERLNTIKEVRATLNQLNITDYPIGSPERTLLEQTEGLLDQLIWKLIGKDIREITDQLNHDKDQLNQVATDLKTANEELNGIGEKVEKTAKIVGVLAEIVVKAMSAGIL